MLKYIVKALGCKVFCAFIVAPPFYVLERVCIAVYWRALSYTSLLLVLPVVLARRNIKIFNKQNYSIVFLINIKNCSCQCLMLCNFLWRPSDEGSV